MNTIVSQHNTGMDRAQSHDCRFVVRDNIRRFGADVRDGFQHSSQSVRVNKGPQFSFHLLILVAVLALFGNADAAQWYAGPSGTGSANGTSWANRWAHTSVVWGGAGVNPGDTLYLDKGTYTSGFNQGVNGTSGNWITISIGQDVGHTGPAIFDANDLTANLFSDTTGMFVCGGSYTHVTGLVGTNRNLWVINTRTSTSDREKGVALFGGVAHDQIWEGITVSNVNNGLAITGSSSSNIVAQYITMRYVRGDFCFRYSASLEGSFTNGLFQYNDMLCNADFVTNGVSNAGGPDGLAGGGGITFHDNIIKWTNGPVVLGQHPDGVQMLANYNKVYNNHFSNPLNSGVKFEPTGALTYWTDCYAWNNVVDVTDPMYSTNTTFNGKGFEFGGLASITGVTNLVCVHNTVADMLGVAMNGGQGTWSTVKGQWVLENNAEYNCGRNTPTNGWITGNSNIVMDFNGGVKGAHGWTNILFDTPGDGSAYTSYYQTNTPAQFSFRTYGEYTAGNDLRLAANVTGGNLGRFASLTLLDANGVTRDTNNPTIGAYEWTSTPQGGDGGTVIYRKPKKVKRNK
jgi:hypothetical protein